MRKLSVLIVTMFCLLSFNQVNAQKEPITAASATKNRGYTVLNKEGAITIYKYQHRAHSPKETEKYAPAYFFTTASSDVLQPLTKDNVKKAFPDNHPFHEAIDATFRSDEELHNYDTYHKMYKLNWLLQEHSH
ncbi:hypothetical protein FC093_17100 [Ilyomonas limi]|uniref:GLPGLI family protein n=1 Tax=Ilyomonas limi TaxID=2575867 RepID=A0A4U3KVD0_9BACT|nr:hypothetical protein [Ilyomonas limi]TKK66302.1 hypothetical protein FC093_17100 [Ilyomonas limi]